MRLAPLSGGGPSTPSEIIRLDAINILGDGVTLVTGVLVVVLIWQITNATEKKSLGDDRNQ